MAFPEAMLLVTKDVMTVQILHKVTVGDVLHGLRTD